MKAYLKSFVYMKMLFKYKIKKTCSFLIKILLIYIWKLVRALDKPKSIN